MSYRANPDGFSWAKCMGLLGEVFDRWKVGEWTWKCPASNTGVGRGRTHWSMFAFQPHEAQVTVEFKHPKDGVRSVTVSRFQYPVNNLWALWKGLDAIRLNELRGLDDVAREFYAALPAPRRERDPWEVLGVRPDADEDVIDASYRAKAKRLHPDAGGSEAAFKELQAAYEAVKHG